MGEHFDRLETRPPAERERDLMARLSAQVAHARKAAAHFGRVLADVDAGAVATRAALAKLPVTR